MTPPAKNLSLTAIALPPVAVAGATAFFYFAAPILVPLVCGVFAAYLLGPAVGVLRHIKVPRVVAVFLVMLITILVLLVAGYFAGQQIGQLTGDLPHYWNAAVQWLGQLQAKIAGWLQPKSTAPEPLNPVASLKWENLTSVSKIAFKGLGSVVNFFFGVILIFFITFFLLLDHERLKERAVRAFGRGNDEVAGKILSEINGQIAGFVAIKFVITVMLAVVITAGLLLFRVKYAFVWGPVAAVLNLIPYIGPVIGLVPPVIVAGIQHQSALAAFWVFVFFVAVQAVESNFLTPRLLSEKVNLNPLAVLVASLYWGWLWGAVGAVLAVPITAMVKVICDHVEALEPIGILLGGKK